MTATDTPDMPEVPTGVDATLDAAEAEARALLAAAQDALAVVHDWQTRLAAQHAEAQAAAAAALARVRQTGQADAPPLVVAPPETPDAPESADAAALPAAAATEACFSGSEEAEAVAAAEVPDAPLEPAPEPETAPVQETAALPGEEAALRARLRAAGQRLADRDGRPLAA